MQSVKGTKQRKERDSETGLYYYGARYLDGKTSRWLSADPALGDYVPGAPVNDEARKRNGSLPGMGGVFNTVNFHLYHYAGNNPIKYVDPDGKLITVQGDDQATYTWDNEKNQLYSGSEKNRNYDIKDSFALSVQSDLNSVKAALNKANDGIALSDFNDLANSNDYKVTIVRTDAQNVVFRDENTNNGMLFYNQKFSNSPDVVDASGNTKFPAFVALGHDIGHARDHFKLGHSEYNNAKVNKFVPEGFPDWVEQSAVEFENIVRRGYNSSPGFQRPRYFR